MAVAAPKAAKTQATPVIATRHEITAAGIETILRAAGHRVVARCSRENDLLRVLKANRPNIIMLSENIVGWEAARTVSRLRARNRSVTTFVRRRGEDALVSHLREVSLQRQNAAGALDGLSICAEATRSLRPAPRGSRSSQIPLLGLAYSRNACRRPWLSQLHLPA